MIKEPSEQTLKMLAEMAKATGGDGSFHVAPVYVCDNPACPDKNRDAFPYGVHGADGRFWNDLCNGCFDSLGCSYGDDPGDYDDEHYQIDEFEAALSECGFSDALGFCSMAGTEFCDWECPLADMFQAK